MEFLEKNSLTSSKARPSASSHKKQKTDVLDLTEEQQLELALAASATSSSGSVEKASSSDDIVETGPPSFFQTIKAHERSEVPASEPQTTIQFRLASGKKIAKKFAKSDKVQVLFAHLKAVEPELKPFELMWQRSQLSKQLDATLQDANVLGAALLVDDL